MLVIESKADNLGILRAFLLLPQKKKLMCKRMTQSRVAEWSILPT